MVPGDNCGTAQLAVHAKGTHLPLQGIAKFLPCFKVPDEVGSRMVKLES